MHIALYEPDIAQNTGTILRLAACLGLHAHIIEPAGFLVSDRAMRRAGMDYLEHVTVTRHVSWLAFRAWRASLNRQPRCVLLTTQAASSYFDFEFLADDILLLGRESAGVPPAIHEEADARITIPMRAGMRSLNVALACAMVSGEALRQTGGFAAPAPLTLGPLSGQ